MRADIRNWPDVVDSDDLVRVVVAGADPDGLAATVEFEVQAPAFRFVDALDIGFRDLEFKVSGFCGAESGH